MQHKKPFLHLLIIILTLALISCRGEVKDSGMDLTASFKDDLFELTIYLDKNSYSAEETIFCYATLEYIGEEDNITVYSSDPLVGFGIKDNKYFDGGYAVNDVLIRTSFQKGQIVKYDFTKSGGWDAEDPNAEFYEKYFTDPNLVLPAGDYEVSATINCALDESDILGSKYKQTVTVLFKVQE